jgi:hypothetical protein
VKLLLNTENKRIIEVLTGLDFVGLKKFIDATEKMNSIAKISNNLQETKDHNKFLEFSVTSYITREFIPFDNKPFIDTKNLNSTWSSFSISKPTMKAVSSSFCWSYSILKSGLVCNFWNIFRHKMVYC